MIMVVFSFLYRHAQAISLSRYINTIYWIKLISNRNEGKCYCTLDLCVCGCFTRRQMEILCCDKATRGGKVTWFVPHGNGYPAEQTTSPYINTLLIRFILSRWLDFCLVLCFCLPVMVLNCNWSSTL